MYKLVFFVPLTHVDVVKNAVFSKGGGRIGNYDCCSFETEGVGQFRPLEGSQPFLGQSGQIEKVKELRVELVVEDSKIKEVVEAMKKAHPYEVPAYDVMKLEDY